MSNYRVLIKQSAEKELSKLPQPALKEIKRALDQLAFDPYHQGTKKLKGFKDLFRVRTGDYRIIYNIQNSILTVLVLKVGHRKDVYK